MGLRNARLSHDQPHAIGRTSNAVPLKRDVAFSRSAVFKLWLIYAAVITGVGIPISWALYYADGNGKWSAMLIPIAISAGFVASCVGLFLCRDGKRQRNIDLRLVAGRHAWGSSDPATWHQMLLERVRKPAELKAGSYEELCERFIAKKQWTYAIFSARLCVAFESSDRGESLTDQILCDADVSEKVKSLRKDPSLRDQHFSQSINLSQWIHGDPRTSIEEIFT